MARDAPQPGGHRGRIFLIYFLLTLFMMIVSMVWQFPAVALVAAFTRSVRVDQLPLWGQLLFQFGGVITQALVGPVMTIAIAFVYYDERVRKEAFDLTQMMQQLDRAVSG